MRKNVEIAERKNVEKQFSQVKQKLPKIRENAQKNLGGGSLIIGYDERNFKILTLIGKGDKLKTSKFVKKLKFIERFEEVVL